MDIKRLQTGLTGQSQKNMNFTAQAKQSLLLGSDSQISDLKISLIDMEKIPEEAAQNKILEQNDDTEQKSKNLPLKFS